MGEYASNLLGVTSGQIDHIAAGGSLITKMGGEATNHFGHWLGEETSAYRGLAYLKEQFGLNYPAILKSTESSFELEALEMLGHDAGIVYKDPYRTLAVGQFVVASNRNVHSHGMEFDPAARGWARDRFKRFIYLERKSQGSGTGAKRVFIHRQRSKTRRLGNFKEVELLLSKYGFISLDPSEISLKRAVSEVAAAEVLVGVYGSGLMNMLLMPDLKELVEICPPPGEVRPVWFQLSHELGVRYWSVGSNRSLDPQLWSPGQGVQDLEWDVNCEELEAVLVELAAS